MPLLIVNASAGNLSDTSIENLHHMGSQILSSEIGKSIKYCMVQINSGCSLSFGQDINTPSAYLEVKNIGELSANLTANISSKLTQLIEEEMGISPDRIYIEFQESERHLWGWNGATFA